MTTFIVIVLIVLTFLATRYWYKHKLDAATLILKEEKRIGEQSFYHHGWREAQKYYRTYPDLLNDLKSHHEV
jgi:hypothetical protein